MTVQKQIGIVNCSATYSSSNPKDSLDLALIMGSFEQPISLFFKSDGVFQLINNQQPESINIKDYLKTFSAFEFYDIEHIYVCETSIKERGLDNDFHIDNVQVLDKTTFKHKLHLMDVIFNF